MQAYHELPYHNTAEISEQVVEYLKNSTDFLSNNSNHVWNTLDFKSILHTCPALVEYFKIYKLLPKSFSMSVCYHNMDLHYDPPGTSVTLRVNFPILNTANSLVRWYTISDEDYAALPFVLDRFGNKYEDISVLPRDRLTLFAEYDMKNPVAFNVRIPHEVVLLENATVPRIVLSCTLHNELLSLL